MVRRTRRGLMSGTARFVSVCRREGGRVNPCWKAARSTAGPQQKQCQKCRGAGSLMHPTFSAWWRPKCVLVAGSSPPVLRFWPYQQRVESVVLFALRDRKLGHLCSKLGHGVPDAIPIRDWRLMAFATALAFAFAFSATLAFTLAATFATVTVGVTFPTLAVCP